MTLKKTVTTTSCQFQLRLPWELRDRIEEQLSDGESLGGWIKKACELRLQGTKTETVKTKKVSVSNAANEKRAAEIKEKIETVIQGMSDAEKTALLSERYPKARFSERSGISKDSVRRYWGEIERLLEV